MKYFEDVARTEKTVRDSGHSNKSGSATHDSGYAEDTTPSARSTATSRPSTSNPPDMPGHRSSKSVAKAAGGVYGVVSYDFHAERPDELDAKEGEAIIVIAQSNPEWFVAKPITRLGGPGLIPVSFIEIRDMTTGRPVEDPVAAVQKAGIPRVEEWKKMAADYKNTSIPLGTVSSSQQAQNLQQSMARASVSSQRYGHSHDRQGETSYQQQQQQNLFAAVRASVPRYVFQDDKFHFVVECRMSNGTHWNLSRIYEDFYELQINLISAFPSEAGQVAGQPRTLPYMPGPVKFVTENISEGRRANLDEYLRDLLRLNTQITTSSLVRTFFAPRQGDYAVDPSAGDLEQHARPMQAQDRYSQVSQGSQHSGAYRQQQQPGQQYNQSQPSNPYGQQWQNQAPQGQPGHFRTPSLQQPQQALAPPLSQPSANMSGTSLGSAATAAAQVKVKAWFDRDTCVVIRLPPRGQFGFEQLYQKIVERRRLEYQGQDREGETLDIQYRDERNGEYYRLEGDEDLDIAVERSEKLTLAVRAVEATPAGAAS